MSKWSNELNGIFALVAFSAAWFLDFARACSGSTGDTSTQDPVELLCDELKKNITDKKGERFCANNRKIYDNLGRFKYDQFCGDLDDSDDEGKKSGKIEKDAIDPHGSMLGNRKANFTPTLQIVNKSVLLCRDEENRTPQEMYRLYCGQGIGTKDAIAPTLCGSDGKTYLEKDSANNSKYGFFGPKSYFTAACKNSSIYVIRTGYCKKGYTTKSDACIDAQQQQNDELHYVCGSDGEVYNNPSDLHAKQACDLPKLTLVSNSLLLCREGSAEQYLDDYCPKVNNERHMNGTPSKFCASNGLTYKKSPGEMKMDTNEAGHFLVDACKDKTLVITKIGSCHQPAPSPTPQGDREDVSTNLTSGSGVSPDVKLDHETTKLPLTSTTGSSEGLSNAVPLQATKTKGQQMKMTEGETKKT